MILLTEYCKRLFVEMICSIIVELAFEWRYDYFLRHDIGRIF